MDQIIDDPKISALSLTGEFTLIQLALSIMARKDSKRRESWGYAASFALERVIGDDKRWAEFSAILIRMMGAGYEERQTLADLAWDHLHDIMCEVFPEEDDGERYTEVTK